LSCWPFLSKLWEARSGFDLQIHDTYFVISPAPVSLAMAFFLAVCSAAYYFIPMNPRAIGLHFWVTSVGLTLFGPRSTFGDI
jgi:heme/copper-type cytochrome/quinol oxidase subunit 1